MKLIKTTVAVLFLAGLILTSCGKHELEPHKKEHKCGNHNDDDDDDAPASATK